MNKQAGFTIAEIMMVIAVLAIFAGFIWVSLNEGSAQARDAERRADLLSLQAALELYRNENGRYPAGCNDGVPTANASWVGYWSGQIGSNAPYECGSAEYIIGLAPEFIPVLPTDPKLNDEVANSGYVYTTNPDGSVYKLMALNTVETETVTQGNEYLGAPAHQFSRCADMRSSAGECREVPSDATGIQPYNTIGGEPAHCQINGGYDDDYAVYGGYATRGYYNSWRGSSGNKAADIRALEYFSDQIRCK